MVRINLIAVLLFIFVGITCADTLNVIGTWNYQGQVMSGCNCALSGQLVLDSLGDPTSWSFTDGAHTLNTSNSVLDLAYLTFFFRGPDDAPWWKLTVTSDSNLSGGVDIFSQFYGSAFESSDAAFGSGESGRPGQWTDPPSVASAEPGTILLVACGVVILLLRKVRIHL